jgi:hypothetical protein
MMNQDQVRLAPTAEPDLSGQLPATLEAASPFRQQSPAFRRFIERMRSQLRAYQCNYEAPFSDDILLGLAQRLSTGAPILMSNPDDAPVAFGRDWDFRAGGSMNYDLMRQYMASFIHHGVLAHELGHSLGQRHNFTASADAINYNDNYWRVRGQGHPAGIRPRYEYLADSRDGHYYSDQEIAGRVDEWSYSSVMDYKGLNEDAHGIGRYDYAFVLNGYVSMVEAFRQVANQDRALMYSANVAGNGLSTPFDTIDWARGGPIHGMHYSMIPSIFGTNPDGTPNIGNANRYNVFLNETQTTSVPGFGSPSFSNVTNDGHVLVPYRFDSDERAGLVWQDQRYDNGADAFESLHYVTSHWLDYYFQNSYARLRSGFSTSGYVSRMWGRYLEQLRQTTQLLAFDLINYADFFADQPGWDAYVNSPTELGGYVNHAAMSMSADAVVAQLTMPEMGTHNTRTLTDGQRLVTNVGFGTGIDIPINIGRAFESNWRQDVGFFWYDMLNRAGSYYDKMLSVDALVDPDLYLLGRDTPVDIRLFQLSYYTMYPDQMIRLFGALLSEDTTDYAPIVQTTGQHPISRTHVATINLPPGAGMNQSGRVIDATHLPIDPQDHFTVQLGSAVNTIAQFPATYDQRYMDYARLWIDGSLESITVANPDTNTVTFTDPWTHETFRALHFGTATGEPGASVGPSPLVHTSTGAVANEAGVAARMLLHVRDLDAARLAATTPAAAAPIETQERQYIDLLHVMRELTRWFGTGHISN